MSPLRTRTWDGVGFVGESDYAPPTFTLGVTEPTPLNTGYPRTGVTMLEVASSIRTISAPGVYRGIRQPVRITADGVTLSDFDIRVPAGAGYGIFVDNPESQSVTIEHGRVWCAPEDAGLNLGIRCRGGAKINRVVLTGVGDGMQVYTSPTGSQPREIEVLGSYIGDLVVVPDPNQNDGLSHNDCIQSQGNLGLRVVGCALYGGRTSGIIATTDVGSTYLRLQITDNWIYPHPIEGSGVNVAAGVAIPNLSVTNNRVAPRATRGGEIRASAANRASAAAFGMVGSSSNAGTWTAGTGANIYTDTGLPVPVTNG